MAADEAEPGDGSGEVTRILSRLGAHAGRGGADTARLAELVHAELRRLASGLLAGERDGHTLQPTALVHEAWLRLADQDRVSWQGRAHFLAIAAQAMRRILLDHARARLSAKRGGGWRAVELDAALPLSDEPASGEARELELLALGEALETLRALAPERARLVELRFFGGLSMDETAEVLGTSLRRAEREWRLAKAWLTHQLSAR